MNCCTNNKYNAVENPRKYYLKIFECIAVVLNSEIYRKIIVPSAMYGITFLKVPGDASQATTCTKRENCFSSGYNKCKSEK